MNISRALFPVFILITVILTEMSHAELPDAFVEYVESTNSATYIDTGIKPIPQETRMVVKLTPTVANDTTVRGLFGSRTSNLDTSGEACSVRIVNKCFRVDWIAMAMQAFIPATNHVYTFDGIGYRMFIDDYLYIGTCPAKSSVESVPLYLFSVNENNSAIVGTPQKLYSCRIYVDGTTLSANYIPCVKDGVAGLYDSVSGTILYSASCPLQASSDLHPDVRINNGKVESRLEIDTTGAGGSISAPGTSWVEVGSTVTLDSTPDSDMQSQWTTTHDGRRNPFTYSGDISFQMPGYAVTATAFFTDAAYAPFCSDLSTVIDNAADGDEIRLAPGTYIIDKEFAIDKAVTIIGAGIDETIITSTPRSFIRGINMTAPATLRNFTLSGFTNHLDGSGIYMTAGTVDTVRVSYNADTKYNLKNGAGIYMNGTGCIVTNSLIDHNYVESMYGSTRGIGIYMNGGLVVDSIIKGNWRNRNEFYGAGIYANGNNSTVLRCRIEGNNSNNNGNDTNNTRGMGIAMTGSALVDNCVIVSNGIHAVFIEGGIIRNSLVYGHKTTSTLYTSGIENKGGNVYNCTVSGNNALNSFAGMMMTAGTAANNIIYGNGSFGDVKITGGTFNTNIVNATALVSTSKANGNIFADPFFTDAANNDYTIGFDSPALDAGATIPGVAVDILGIARPQSVACDIGCYEYTFSATDLNCAIIVPQNVFQFGSSQIALARVIGGSGTYTYEWYVDDVLSDQTSAAPTFDGLALGRHTLRLVVSDGVTTDDYEYPDAFEILSTNVYVDADGANIFPYATPETAAHSVNEAWNALYRAAGGATITIAAGIYNLSSELVCDNQVSILGAGRDKTILNGKNLGGLYRAINILAADSVVRDITITGCTNNLGGAAIKMQADGLISNVRTTLNCAGLGSGSLNAGIISMSGGIVTNSVIDNNKANSSYGGINGIGVAMSGGLLVDSEIAFNWRNRTEFYGGGVHVSGGTVRRCYIHDNNNVKAGGSNNTRGMGICLNGTKALVENCFVISNGIQGVYLQNGKLYNTLVSGHVMTKAGFAGGVDQIGGEMYNCTIAGNTAITADKNDFWSTKGITKNNIAPVAFVTGGTHANNVFNTDPLFKNAESGNYHLLRTSPAVDAGDNSVWNAFTLPLDLDGNPRIINSQNVDCGCYELPPLHGTLMSIF